MKIAIRFLAFTAALTASFSLLAQPQGLAGARSEMSTAAAKRDKTAFASFLSDDVTSVDRAGWLRDKVAAVDDLPPGTQSEADVRSYRDAAVVAIDSQSEPIHAHIIQAWVLENGHWQIVAQQDVTVGNGAVTPASRHSAALPPSSGPQAERNAVQKNIDTTDDAIRKGDPKKWGNAVADLFVEIAKNGDFRSRKERMDEITTAGPQPNLPTGTPRALSIRIHGNFAVINRRLHESSSADKSSDAWQTIVAVREAGRWLQAAVITTLITGVA